MMNMVLKRSFSEMPVNRKEVLRYACAKSAPELEELLDECIAELCGLLRYSVCYAEYNIQTDDRTCDLGFAKINSFSLAKNLDGCSTAVLFAATVGIAPDRMISKYKDLSPSKALMFQALGAERIESLCDEFVAALSIENGGKVKLRPRFSPGYGDVDISLQRDIFKVLDCPKQIGLTLNESLIMSPSKSVTAIIGISDKGE